MSKYDLLLHVDKVDGSINVAFNNTVNYVNALSKETFKILLVVNSKAVTQMVKGAEQVDQTKMEAALKAGLKIKVCRNALNENGVNTADLHPACEVVPAGIVEIVERQKDGYAYVKP